MRKFVLKVVICILFIFLVVGTVISFLKPNVMDEIGEQKIWGLVRVPGIEEIHDPWEWMLGLETMGALWVDYQEKYLREEVTELSLHFSDDDNDIAIVMEVILSEPDIVAMELEVDYDYEEKQLIYYDVKKERYQIIDIWEEKDGRSLFSYNERYTIKAEKIQVIMDHTWGYCNYTYLAEGTPKEQDIRCLNVTAYKDSHIQGNKLTTENGDIIGLVHVPRESCYDSFDPSQDDLKYDALFRLNPQTGENSILYKTENNCTRIIGYQDGAIYLLRDFKIYSSIMESREEKLIAELPEDTYYEFDWQGDYLIVICQDGIYGAYKVR